MSYNNVGFSSRGLLLDLVGFSIQQQREDAVLGGGYIQRQLTAIQLAVPALAHALQLDAIGLLRDSDFIDHSLRSPSRRPARFQAESSSSFLRGPALTPVCPFFCGAEAANNAAETAAISGRPLPEA